MWAKETDCIVVLGEPAAVAAVRVLEGMPAQAPASKGRRRAAGAGTRPGFAALDAPDPVALAAAFDGARAPLLVVLDGPPWVRALAEVASVRAASAFVVGEPGADEWTLPGAARAAAPGATDPRFGAMGGAALAVAAARGVPVEAALDGLRRMAQRCAQPGMFDNPAYLLASLVDAAAEERGLTQIALLLPSPRMADWGGWARGAWTAVVSKTRVRDSVRDYHGTTPMIVQAGDEAMVQRLIDGPRNVLTLALWADEVGAPVAEGAAATWELARGLMGAHVKQLVTSGRPVVRIGFGAVDASHLLELAMMWVHAAVASAARAELDPLAMPAADRWREILQGDEE
jgi:hypothetical protein